MRQVRLGKTGMQVSQICLGTMTWGSQNTEADGHAQMDMALAAGVNFWDTAEMYPVNPVRAETVGRSEEIIGSWLAARGGRDGLVLATKVTSRGSCAMAFCKVLSSRSNQRVTCDRLGITASGLMAMISK